MIQKIFKIVTYIFAIIGLIFTAVYVGMQLGVFNVKGSISARNSFFQKGEKPSVIVATPPCNETSVKICDWNQTPEWAVVKGGLEKDTAIIQRVSAETGVSARMIASVVVPEQIRFFTANREVFKRYFEPLKILGSLSQFSLGVSGIKQETAENIEKYASDPTSPFYPGDGMSALITYAPGVNHSTELYSRLTDDKNHYYQYLYTALYIKEIQTQWANAGFDISTNPGVVVTLFNLGFQVSSPKPNPAIGGSVIVTGGQKITYGDLGAKFHESDELRSFFP